MVARGVVVVAVDFDRLVDRDGVEVDEVAVAVIVVVVACGLLELDAGQFVAVEVLWSDQNLLNTETS